MTENTQTSQVEQKPTDKEINFRALEQKYQKQLEQERAARMEAERLAQEVMAKKNVVEDEETDEPYVDHKKLSKVLNNFGQQNKTEIQKAMEAAKMAAKEEIQNEMWLENNPDFYDVMKHAEKFAIKSPKLAQHILKMPDSFERQKLVYENIKELGLDKPEVKQSSVQDRIDANRKSPYYQPSGVGAAPYNAGMGDFSDAGKKNAYAKLQELLKNRKS